jgi:hypothetical protein
VLEDMDWIGMAQNRDKWRPFVKAVMNLEVPHNAWNFSGGCTTSGHSSSAPLHGVS